MENAKIPDNESERLAALEKYGILGNTANKIFHDLTALAAAICKAPIATITLIDKDREWYYTKYGTDDVEALRDISFCAHTILQEDMLIISDALEDERFFDNPFVTDDPPRRFYAAAPLITADGYAIGALCVIDSAPKNLDKKQIATLEKIRDNIVDQLEFQYLFKGFLSSDEYHIIFDSAPDAMVIVNKIGNMMYVNQRTLTLFGYSQEELIGNNVDILLPERLRNKHSDHRTSYQLDPKTRPMGGIDTDLVGLHKDGNEFPVEISLSPLTSTDGTIFISGSIRDVSERKQAEERLQRSEEKYRLLVETMHEGVGATDKNAKLTFVNNSLCKMMAATHEELIGRHLTEFLDERNIKILRDRLKDRKRGKHEPYEIIWTALDGRKVETLITPAPLFDNEGNSLGSFGTITDITERKKAQAEIVKSQEQLRELANQLQVVREEERTKISREIHDQLGQNLSFLKIDLSCMLERLTPEQKDLQERARNDLMLMDETLQAVRQISHELRPAVLDVFGLEAAIENQVEGFNQRTGTTCLCKLELKTKDIGLDNKRDTVVFRVLQEALSNVAQHAQANHAKVTLSTLDSQLLLSVEDNGIGIDKKEKTSKKDSFGIISMRERCQAIGGEFQIELIDEGGTRVICSVPLSVAA